MDNNNFSGVNIFHGGQDILDLNFISETFVYMDIGPCGETYKTTDDEFNWTWESVPVKFCFVQASYFFNEDSWGIGDAGCFSWINFYSKIK